MLILQLKLTVALQTNKPSKLNVSSLLLFFWLKRNFKDSDANPFSCSNRYCSAWRNSGDNCRALSRCVQFEIYFVNLNIMRTHILYTRSRYRSSRCHVSFVTYQRRLIQNDRLWNASRLCYNIISSISTYLYISFLFRLGMVRSQIILTQISVSHTSITSQ